ncbi:MAG: tetratricopeptide repeat protein, partial [Bacteroidetes bacterium]
TKPETVPDNDLAWANLAQAYLNISQFEASRSAAEKALAISPDDIQANNLIGLYGLSKGDVVKAVSVFQAALKREPSNPSAYYYLAMIAQREGNNQAALNLLMKAIQSGPTFKLAYELSARIYESMGNQAAAQRFRATMQQIK